MKLSQSVPHSVLIIGFGSTGRSIFSFLKTYLPSLNIFIYDDNLESLSIDDQIIKYDINTPLPNTIFVSPGVKMTHPLVKKALQNKSQIMNDIELFLQLVDPNKKIIGVTGSNGKSTTVSLIHHILGNEYALCGNIGKSPLDFFNLKDDKYLGYIIEISSAQLQTISSINRIDLGVLINIIPNHFDIHGNMENYKMIKSKICEAKSAMICIDDDNTYDIFQNIKKEQNYRKTSLSMKYRLTKDHYYYDNTKDELYYNNFKVLKFQYTEAISSSSLFCAASVCHFLNIPCDDIAQKVLKFKALSHRTELLNCNGVICINDSKATTVYASIFAIQQIKKKYDEKKIIVILGGGDAKRQNFSILVSEIQHLHQVYMIGSCRERMAEECQTQSHNIIVLDTLEQTLKNIYETHKMHLHEICILFSPGCESFDQYNNFEHRGEEFKNLCKNIFSTSTVGCVYE